MAWLKNIFGGDEYENCADHFITKGTFTTETVCGYKICYAVICNYSRVDKERFKAARMLEKENQAKLLKSVNDHLVIPTFKSKGRFWRLRAGRYGQGALCRISKDGDESYVYNDHSCIDLNAELTATPFKDFGCSAHAAVDICDQSDEIIEENYKRMIMLYGSNAIENSGKYMVEEESILVAAAKRELDLQREFRQHQTERFHKGEKISITTRLAGRALEIAWKFEQPLSPNASFRGYRKEGGFSPEVLPLASNGACVADSRVDDKTVLTLAAGADHFFTFAITKSGTDGLYVVESLRFSVRLPTVEELAHAEKLILTMQANQQKVTMSKKTSDAVQELLSFVEFEESITGVEKQLIDRISSKSYSPEEKANKIGRLKSVVESLRVANS